MKLIICALKCEDIFGNAFICGVGAQRLPDFSKIDQLINIGVCGGDNVGKLYLANKIIGDKCYYPDIFNNCNIDTAPLTTSNDPVKKIQPGMLYDMEAAKLYCAASKYLGPHQMHFLKVVSDSGETIDDKNHINQLIRMHKDAIQDYIGQLEQWEEFHDKIKSSLRLSEAMKIRHKQQLKYANLIGADVSQFLQAGMNKKDTIKALDEIDEYLVEVS